MKFPPGYVPGAGVHKASGFGGFGERLLRKHGWEKGEGLGKNKTGRAEAIQVKKKEDTAGVSMIYCDLTQIHIVLHVGQGVIESVASGWSKQESSQLRKVVGRCF